MLISTQLPYTDKVEDDEDIRTCLDSAPAAAERSWMTASESARCAGSVSRCGGCRSRRTGSTACRGRADRTIGPPRGPARRPRRGSGSWRPGWVTRVPGPPSGLGTCRGWLPVLRQRK